MALLTIVFLWVMWLVGHDCLEWHYDTVNEDSSLFKAFVGSIYIGKGHHLHTTVAFN